MLASNITSWTLLWHTSLLFQVEFGKIKKNKGNSMVWDFRTSSKYQMQHFCPHTTNVYKLALTFERFCQLSISLMKTHNQIFYLFFVLPNDSLSLFGEMSELARHVAKIDQVIYVSVLNTNPKHKALSSTLLTGSNSLSN